MAEEILWQEDRRQQQQRQRRQTVKIWRDNVTKLSKMELSGWRPRGSDSSIIVESHLSMRTTKTTATMPTTTMPTALTTATTTTTKTTTAATNGETEEKVSCDECPFQSCEGYLSLKRHRQNSMNFPSEKFKSSPLHQLHRQKVSTSRHKMTSDRKGLTSDGIRMTSSSRNRILSSNFAPILSPQSLLFIACLGVLFKSINGKRGFELKHECMKIEKIILCKDFKDKKF